MLINQVTTSGSSVLGVEKTLVAGDTLPKGSMVSASISSGGLQYAIQHTPLSAESGVACGVCHLENDIFALYEVNGSTCHIRIIKVDCVSSVRVICETTQALNDTLSSGGSIAAHKSGSTWYVLFTYVATNSAYLYCWTFTNNTLAFNSSATMQISGRSTMSDILPFSTPYGFLVITAETYGIGHISHWGLSTGTLVKNHQQSVSATITSYSSTYFSCWRINENTFRMGVDCLDRGYRQYVIQVTSESDVTAECDTTISNGSNYGTWAYDANSGLSVRVNTMSNGNQWVITNTPFYDSTNTIVATYSNYDVHPSLSGDLPILFFNRKILLFISATQVLEIMVADDYALTDKVYNLDDTVLSSIQPTGCFPPSCCGKYFALVVTPAKYFIISLGDFMEGEPGSYIGVLLEDSTLGENCQVMT